jgi:hypothetical protein
MKTRHGFVSNSSSSSFIVCSNKRLEASTVRKALMHGTQLNEPIMDLLGEALANFISMHSNFVADNKDDFEKWLEERWFGDAFKDNIRQIKDKFKFVYHLSVGTEADDDQVKTDCIGQAMYVKREAFDLEDNDFKIKYIGE